MSDGKWFDGAEKETHETISTLKKYLHKFDTDKL